MKTHLQQLLSSAIESLQQDGHLDKNIDLNIQIERARDIKHGDYASNIALTLAKNAKCKPRDLAEKIVAVIPASDRVEKTEIAGPGFINFYLTASASQSVVKNILEQGDKYGHSQIGAGERILIEFVSANPTGPLHVGHGRGAAYGAALANLLETAGYAVHREYYVNDSGRQMDILATSVWLRYLELCGEEIEFPSNAYHGDYVFDIAANFHREHGSQCHHPSAEVLLDVPADISDENQGDKEAHIDGLITRAKALLSAAQYRELFDAGLDVILHDIKQDLAEFGVTFESWFSERTLVETGAIDKAIESLRQLEHVYESEGCLWFRSTAFGDEKDRVVIRKNGAPTYLASDIAYHLAKFERGFDRLIDIWGADHHGYIARVKGSLQALGKNPDQLDVLLVQFAILYLGKERMQMSTRSGEYVSLRELRDEVGNDAARFFYVMRKCEQHMDFDLELAKSTSNDNPVYYIQYAHARICSVLRQLDEKGHVYDMSIGLENLHLLSESHEKALLTQLSSYPSLIEAAALNREPHQLAHYLRDLANDFHTYYNANQFIVDNEALRNARLALVVATQQILRNCLHLLGVSAPESM
jgi:arginyl-tRNA synthetase